MSDIQESGYGRATANIAIATTTQTAAVTSEKIKVTRPSMRVLILAFITVQSGAGTTAITPRILSGSDTTGVAVSEGLAHETTAAEFATWTVAAEDVVSGIDEVQYTATVQQAAATANGTILNATILVFLF